MTTNTFIVDINADSIFRERSKEKGTEESELSPKEIICILTAIYSFFDIFSLIYNSIMPKHLQENLPKIK